MVNLFTRPRRFGKTLALSILRTFFELEYDFDGNVIDKKHYFTDKKIMQCDEVILSKMGKYPVITLPFLCPNSPCNKSPALLNLSLRDSCNALLFV